MAAVCPTGDRTIAIYFANQIRIKAARERKKLKLAPASGVDRTNHEEHSNKIVGAKKSSLEKSMPMLVWEVYLR